MRRDRGFTLTEVLAVLAIMAIIAAMATPGLLASLDSMRINSAARSVHSEMSRARLKAVSANRPVRVRFNCPVAGAFRMVELIGTPALPDARDSDTNRCSTTSYPYPAADNNALTLPNNDGPLQGLREGMAFISSQTIEFRPDGTAHADAGIGNPWPAIGTSVTIGLKYKTLVKTITVNGVGKVQIE